MKRPKMIIVSKDGKVDKKQFERDMRALRSMANFMAKKAGEK